jgi:hypothetical protein
MSPYLSSLQRGRPLSEVEEEKKLLEARSRKYSRRINNDRLKHKDRELAGIMKMLSDGFKKYCVH